MPQRAQIPIEQRAGTEVSDNGGRSITPAGTPCRNPAFDVTPAALVSALVTERGVAAPPDRETVGALARSCHDTATGRP